MTAMFKLQNSSAICPTHQVNMVVIVGNTICPKCAVEDLEKSKNQELSGQADQWVNSRTKQAFFPRRHADCTLKSYFVKNEGQQIAVKECVQFSKDLEANLPKNLTLVGSTGTGKTHLVCGVGRYMIKKNRSVRYITSAEIAEMIIGSWSIKDQTEQSEIAKLAAYDLLIVDEIGLHDSSATADGKAKSMNDMKRQAVHKVLSKRYDDMKSTILVSNFDQTALKTWLGDRLWSRFHDNGSQLVECNWTDSRTGGAV